MSDARRYEYNGEMLTVRQAAERLGVSRTTLDVRLRSGMTIDQAINAGFQPRQYEYKGEWKSLKELAGLAGLSLSGFKKRIAKGDTIEEAVEKGRAIYACKPKPKPKPKPEPKTEPEPAKEPQRLNRRAAAHCIINTLIYGEKLPIRMLADGTWIYKGGFCVYAVRFIDDGRAELTAYSRRTGGAIMRREFMIGGRGVTEVPRCQPNLYFPTNG